MFDFLKTLINYLKPTPEKILRKQLYEAQMERVIAVAKIEDWQAQMGLCLRREHRILSELKSLENSRKEI